MLRPKTAKNPASPARQPRIGIEMKHPIHLLALFLLSAHCVNASEPAKSPRTVSELSNSLESVSSSCSSMAAAFKSEDSLASYQSDSDRRLSNLKIRLDTDVYRVGHGSAQTTMYMAQRMKEQAEKEAEASNQLAARMADHSNQVSACISTAEDHGKSFYSAFKKSNAKNKQIDQATALMTVWLVNLKSISTQEPKGSKEADAAWQNAKTRAELDSI